MAGQLPVLCEKCGFLFFATIPFSGTWTMHHNLTNCPSCQTLVPLPDGTFSFMGDTVHVLSASELTLERLRRFQAILEQARRGEISNEAAEKALAEEAPELAGFFERFGPTMGKVLLIFLGLVLNQLATRVTGEILGDSPATKADVEHAVERAVQLCQLPPDPP